MSYKLSRYSHAKSLSSNSVISLNSLDGISYDRSTTRISGNNQKVSAITSKVKNSVKHNVKPSVKAEVCLLISNR